MSMNIAQRAASPPVLDTRRDRIARPATDGHLASTRADGSSERRATASGDRRATNNEIERDATTGLMVVRTVDVGTGDVVAQNPTEAYLRLAHAMTETVRAELGDRVADRNLGTNVVA